jgi:hypothetical protein
MAISGFYPPTAERGGAGAESDRSGCQTFTDEASSIPGFRFLIRAACHEAAADTAVSAARIN